MNKKGYKVNDDFSPQSFAQTDFGGIYHNTPKTSEQPESVEELANTLKEHNKRGIPVTIRNTGHSINGQTLTDGSQINISKIKHLWVDYEKMEATVGAGVSWHELFQKIDCSKYTTPIFPNNPYQQIQVGGTAAVGGLGIFGSKYGGFWNWVTKITLVTMEGEILECSREKNKELFAYSLGGFGRIGVIADITIKIREHSNKLFIVGLAGHKKTDVERIVAKAMLDEKITGVTPLYQVRYTKLLKKIKFTPTIVSLYIEAGERDTPESIAQYVKSAYTADFFFYIKGTNKKLSSLDFSDKPVFCRWEHLVYWYPVHLKTQEQFDYSHPWSDYIITPEKYTDFVEQATDIVREHRMEKYLIKYSAFNERGYIDTYGSYIIRKLEPDTEQHYPVALDIPGTSQYAYAFGIFPAVPFQEIDRAIHMIKEVDELFYYLGGRRYLYGYHDLSKNQIEKHFGKEVIKKWNTIKQKLDPKHLLNIGVIEHLDGF